MKTPMLILLLGLYLSPIVNAQGYFPHSVSSKSRQGTRPIQKEQHKRTTEEFRRTEQKKGQNDNDQIRMETAQDILNPSVETICTTKSGCD